MNIHLDHEEARILGCLLEKEMATPEYYPLTLNALVNACNQKTNREPVVCYDEATVLSALDSLREKKLIRQSNVSRVVKYEQIFTQELKLIAREEAVLCILLLRGPQTIGEIRGRSERLYAFPSLDEVKETLTSLEDVALIRQLPRQPGRKEPRYAHLLSGEPQETEADTPVQAVAAPRAGSSNADRLEDLQQQIDSLREEMQQLREELARFRSQFE